MNNPRNRWVRNIVLLVMAAPVPAAHAGVFKDFAIGLSLFDVRLSGEHNLLGDGFTIRGDAFYNNRRFNFGLADLTLTGALRGSAGYTMRGLPAAEFTLDTGGSPLSYTFNFNSGIQDLTATGSVLVNINTDINALGFYDQSVQISNRGTFAIDGFGPSESGTLDFDVGPINVSGNILADTLAVLTEPFFAATGTVNPFEKFSSRATKAAELEKTSDELRARVIAGEVLSDQEIATLVNNTILAAVLGGEPSDHLFDDLMLPPDLLDELQADRAISDLTLMETPEPATWLMMSLALLATRRRRLMSRGV